MTEWADIKQVIVLLAMGRPEITGMCGHWTSRHQQAVSAEGLGPWLYKSLRDPVKAGLTPSILDEFRRDYRRSALTCLYREAALRKLFGAFNASGIPVIPLKGCYLVGFVHDDPALRPMCDIDLLVRKEHFDQAGRELEHLGYQPLFGPNQDEDPLSMWPMLYQALSPVPELIDVHRSIQSMDYYRFPETILWENAVEKELYGCKVFCLSAELNFIHIALHIFDHRGTLRDWVDLVTIARAPNLEWDRLVARLSILTL